LPALPLWLWRRSAPPQAAIFSLCWFSAIFLFFSSSTGKCFVYILPAFPGLAATFGLLVDYLDKPGADTAVTRTFSAGSAILGIGGLVTGAATMLLAAAGPIPALSRHLHSDDRRYLLILGSLVGHPAFIFFMLAWIGGALALLMGWRLRLMRLQLGGAVALASAGTAFWLGAMNPALSRRQSLKAFAGQVDAIVPATATIDFIGPMDYDFGFYSNHAVGHADDFDCSSPSHGRHYLIVYQDGFARLSSSRTKCLNLIATSPSVDRHGTRMLFTDGAPP
jgi:4-amino-4-deoxy-L-arabinose transferase-like glycosyltransferase